MTVMVVDADEAALDRTLHDLKMVVPKARAAGFSNAQDALSFIRRNSADVVIMETFIAGMDGFALAKLLRAEQPALEVIYLTDSSAQAINAFEVSARWYLLKPLPIEALRRAMQAILPSSAILHQAN